MTLSDVEMNCGVTASTISKIEKGSISPSYANLLRISKGLGVDVVQLVSEDDYLPAKTRRSINRFGDGPVHSIGSHDYQVLCSELISKKMLPMLATIRTSSLEEVKANKEKGGDGHLFTHEGEEVLFVVSGEIILYTQHYAPVVMKKGDCAYLDSTMGHVCVRNSEEDALVFWVCSDTSTMQQVGLEALPTES